MSTNPRAMHAMAHTFNGAIENAYLQIQDADCARKRAESELVRALESAWPVGSEVEFYLNGSQKNASRGFVLYHAGDGHLRVRMGEMSIYGSYAMKRVHFTNMATPPRPRNGKASK